MPITCDVDLLRLIRDEMHRQGIREMELSRRSNVKQSTINRFMNGGGSMRTENMFSIMNALSINLGGDTVTEKKDYGELKFLFSVCFMEEVELFKNIPDGIRPAFNRESQKDLCDKAADKAIERFINGNR